MATVTFTIQARVVWWFRYLYVPGLRFFAGLGFEPDMDKVEAMAKKAIRFYDGKGRRL